MRNSSINSTTARGVTQDDGTVSRSYAVEEEGARRFKRTESFGSQDLLDLRRVVVAAEAYISEQPI